MDEPFAALDALARRKMQDELLQLWADTRFTVLFVTHSIPEAVLIGNRILLLSPHPGQVKGELNSDGSDAADPDRQKLSDRSTTSSFAASKQGCALADARAALLVLAPPIRQARPAGDMGGGSRSR
jgi:ABC-type nitrate/sulfonate/bicarbonate transport system ATPase subunit